MTVAIERSVTAKRVLYYLRGAADSGIMFKFSNKECKGYADADWEKCPREEPENPSPGSREYVSVIWICFLECAETTVASSSTEAERLIFFDGCVKAEGSLLSRSIFIRQLDLKGT